MCVIQNVYGSFKVCTGMGHSIVCGSFSSVCVVCVLFEGYRPGVMEKLGLSPEKCLKLNESLVYGRMTGWGQDGPMSKQAGHDINYISLSKYC